jgi:hypothetical protein
MRNYFMTMTLLLAIAALGFDTAQAQTSSSDYPTAGLRFTNLLTQARPSRQAAFSLIPSSHSRNPGASAYTITPLATGPNLQVLGSGTIGRLTKWTGLTSSNSSIGDSTIFEDKDGNVGIGTDTPTSRLTVGGTIQLLSGGVKFADGTLETSAFSLNGLMGSVTLVAGTNITITPSGKTLTIAAPNALTAVSHDATLAGSGTNALPLGIANGGVGTSQLASSAVTSAKLANAAVLTDRLANAAVTNDKIASAAVTADKIASGQTVKGLNGLSDQVTLAAGANISITSNGNTLTIASATTDPAVTAFQKQLTIDLPDSGVNTVEFDISVPANKRLIIECVTMEVYADTDSKITFYITTHIGNGEDVRHYFTPTRVNDNGFAFSQQVRVYADETMTALFTRLLPGSRPAIGRISISGHLVDLP